MLLGFAGVGFMAYRRKEQADIPLRLNETKSNKRDRLRAVLFLIGQLSARKSLSEPTRRRNRKRTRRLNELLINHQAFPVLKAALVKDFQTEGRMRR
jgi:hypothetical protein